MLPPSKLAKSTTVEIKFDVQTFHCLIYLFVSTTVEIKFDVQTKKPLLLAFYLQQ